MASRTAPECSEPTTALRQRSPDLLRSALARALIAFEPEVEIDFRDVLVGLAVYVDCARRLDIDLVELFDSASTGRSEGMRELATGFARRTDVTLDAFGWRLVSESFGGWGIQARFADAEGIEFGA